MNFPEYARHISHLLDEMITTQQTISVNLQIDQRSTLRGFITGILTFDDDSELHFREFVDVTRTEPRIMYAYHYQDAAKSLVFRYDNAAHRPKLPQPEHKHTASGVTPQFEQSPLLLTLYGEGRLRLSLRWGIVKGEINF